MQLTSHQHSCPYTPGKRQRSILTQPTHFLIHAAQHKYDNIKAPHKNHPKPHRKPPLHQPVGQKFKNFADPQVLASPLFFHHAILLHIVNRLIWNSK